MDELDLRRISEVSYLNTDNTWRYRSILHFCFKRHEHMQTYVYPEDIFHYLKQDPHFRDYTFDQLEQDLAALCDWKNLIPHQETSRSKTIADFKKKRYRYQCSPYTVEIERMLERLRSVGEEFGGSLETTQFDRILQCLRKFLFLQEELPSQELYQIWQDLEHYFRTLVQNSSDYLAHLKSAKVEERMQTTAFIVYKDRFTQYLRTFVVGLQRSAQKMEKLFQQSNPELEEKLFARLADHQMGIAIMGEAEAQEKDAEAFQASVRAQLDYRRWFRFRLYYDKGEQIKRRELTDKAFFRFSGGEKAMAMYVPLFSAAYSRYMDAGEEAPRLITLDEAFAGVDEQNMRDMFRLVEQMGFNYIMNSQAVWGDYDVVPSLNIYELLRPLNAGYVSLLPYHWDGREKKVMLEAEDG